MWLLSILLFNLSIWSIISSSKISLIAFSWLIWVKMKDLKSLIELLMVLVNCWYVSLKEMNLIFVWLENVINWLKRVFDLFLWKLRWLLRVLIWLVMLVFSLFKLIYSRFNCLEKDYLVLRSVYVSVEWSYYDYYQSALTFSFT